MFNAYHEGQFFEIHEGVTGERFIEMMRLWRIAAKHGMSDYEVRLALQDTTNTRYEIAFRGELRYIAETRDKHEASEKRLLSELDSANEKLKAYERCIEEQKELIKEKDRQIETDDIFIGSLIQSVNSLGGMFARTQNVSFTPIVRPKTPVRQIK